MGFLGSIGAIAGGAIGSVVPGVGTAIGAGIGGALGSAGDYALNRHDSRDAASRANNYALYMSGSAHQREVADLRAAGLNPVLSALGSGASTVAVPVGNRYNDVDSSLVQRALDSRLRSEADMVASQIRKNDADIASAHAVAENQREQAKSQEVQRGLTAANTALVLADRLRVDANVRLLDAQRLKELEDVRARGRTNDFYESLRKSSRELYHQAIGLEQFGSSAASIAAGQALVTGLNTRETANAKEYARQAEERARALQMRKERYEWEQKRKPEWDKLKRQFDREWLEIERKIKEW